MDRHFAQTQDCVCRKEHTTGIGRDDVPRVMYPEYERYPDSTSTYGSDPASAARALLQLVTPKPVLFVTKFSTY